MTQYLRVHGEYGLPEERGARGERERDREKGMITFVQSLNSLVGN